jgi:hypothetical protein
MNKLTRFFWICAGVDESLMKECPTESSKYTGIGATVFFTGLFAAIAAAYALHSVFDNIWMASFFGLIWGLMIFNLDRYIVSGMRKEGKMIKQWLIATPRIILALIISIVIAKPLELKIFEKEVSEELEIMHQEQLQRREALVAGRFEPEKEFLRQQNLQLQQEINTLAAKRDELRRIAREEADGTGGTGVRNAGPIYAIKKADADRLEQELEELEKRNTTQIQENQRSLIVLDTAQQAALAGMTQKPADGLASKIEALGRLTDKSQPVAVANIFIMLLFIAVETAPIFVKLIAHKGPYDHLLKVKEYPYEVSRIETLTKETSASRERMEQVNVADKTFANDRLDAALGSS